MLAPQGFTSLASLWAEFQNRQAREILQEACRTYTRPEFLGEANYGPAIDVGSPVDFLEHVFIQSVSPFCLHLCDTNAPKVETAAQLANGDGDLFRRLTVYESTVFEQEDADRPDGPQVSRMGGDRFKAWPHRLEDPELWSQAYPEPRTPEQIDNLRRTCPYHKLPMCIERDRFTICKSLPPWSTDALDEIYVREYLPEVFGLTICLAKQDAAAWRMSHIVGQEFRSVFPCRTSVEKRIGRPRKQEKVREFCEVYYREGELPSSKIIERDFQRERGMEVSAKTVSRALSKSKSSQ